MVVYGCTLPSMVSEREMQLTPVEDIYFALRNVRYKWEMTLIDSATQSPAQAVTPTLPHTQPFPASHWGWGKTYYVPQRKAFCLPLQQLGRKALGEQV